jgi:hypothetical protein
MRETRRMLDGSARRRTAPARRRGWLAVLLTVTLLTSLLAGRDPVAASADPTVPTGPPTTEVVEAPPEHPFLVVREGEYAALRARADR